MVVISEGGQIIWFYNIFAFWFPVFYSIRILRWYNSVFQVSDECSLTSISRETDKTTLNSPTYFIHTEYNFTKILKPVTPKTTAKFKEQWTSNYIHMKKTAEGFVNILKYLLLFFFLLAVYFPLIKYWAPWDKQSAYFNAWKSHSTLCRLRQINTKAHYRKMSPAIAFNLPVLATWGMCVLYFHLLHMLI